MIWDNDSPLAINNFSHFSIFFLLIPALVLAIHNGLLTVVCLVPMATHNCANYIEEPKVTQSLLV